MTTYEFWPDYIEGLNVVARVKADTFAEALIMLEEFVRRGLEYKPHCRG